jgi:hypothetical protein
VRLVLILSLLGNLNIRQIDYVNAYTQAPADCDIFMSIPASFTIQNGTLEFSGTSARNNYGLKQAGNNWFDALKTSLLSMQFRQSDHDPCLFIRNNCLILVYVDDCLIFSKDYAILDSVIDSLHSVFILTSQGSVGAYLGIDIKKTASGFIELTQPGLIQKIITACGLQDQSAEHSVPVTTILSADLDGPPCEHSWNYRSLIGSVKLFGFFSSSIHCLCCTSVCKIYHQSTPTTRARHSSNCTLSQSNFYKRLHPQTFVSTQSRLLCRR